jgi:prepilin-type N-terminal cleavage/methylation domain-containing protein
MGKREKENVPTGNVGGFTLIELLVVLAVTTLLSGFVILYGSSARQNIAVSSDTAQVVQLVLRAKSLAIATYANNISPCAYGIMVEAGSPNYYLVEYPKDSDGKCPNIGSYSSPADRLASYKLYSGFVFDGCPDDVCPKKLSYALFVPPDPKTLIGNYPDPNPPGANGSGNIYITAVGDQSSYKAEISVNWGGQVTSSR